MTEKQTETDLNCQKYTEMNGSGQKRTGKGRNRVQTEKDKNGQKRSDTNRNGMKWTRAGGGMKEDHRHKFKKNSYFDRYLD